MGIVKELSRILALFKTFSAFLGEFHDLIQSI